MGTGACVPQVLVTGPVAGVVWNRAATRVVCEAGTGGRLAAGAARVAAVRWDGLRCAGREPARCPGGPLAPGRYTVTAIWSLARGSARLQITR